MMIRKILVVAFAALAVMAMDAGEAKAGFGAGLSFGDTGGITGEYSIKGRTGGRGLGQAVEATVGMGNDGYAHVVWKAYAKNIMRRSSFQFVFFAGAGPFVAGGDGILGLGGGGGKGKKGKGKDKDKGDKGKGGMGGGDRAFGARVPVGVAMEFRKIPAHAFVELSAYADSDDFTAIDTTTLAGFRWFF